MFHTCALIFAWNLPLLITGAINFVVGLLVGTTLRVFDWGKRMNQLEARMVSLGSDIRDVGADVKVRSGDLGSKLQTLTEMFPTAKAATDLLGREIGLQLTQIENSIKALTDKSDKAFGELTKHRSDCEDHVIGPLKEQLGEIKIRVGIPA